MIAEQMRTYLMAEGIAGLYVGLQPDRPDSAVTLFDESAPVEPYHNAFNTDTSGLQVLVRDSDYRAARDRCRQIHRLLAGYHGSGVVLTSTVTPPASIGQDERGRPEWTAHYTFAIKDTEANAFRQTT